MWPRKIVASNKKQTAKRKPGRPVVGLNRRPRNIQMSDQAYARLVQIGNGRAADGIDKLLEEWPRQAS